MPGRSDQVSALELSSARKQLPRIDRRATRVRAGLSLADVANHLGVTPSAVHRWELYGRQPRADVIVRYVRLLEQLDKASAA